MRTLRFSETEIIYGVKQLNVDVSIGQITLQEGLRAWRHFVASGRTRKNTRPT